MSRRLQNVCSGCFQAPRETSPTAQERAYDLRFCVEPERGIEPLTYALRERRSAV